MSVNIYTKRTNHTVSYARKLMRHFWQAHVRMDGWNYHCFMNDPVRTPYITLEMNAEATNAYKDDDVSLASAMEGEDFTCLTTSQFCKMVRSVIGDT